VPAVTGVLETSLYVADLRRAATFYQAVFGFERLDGDDRFTSAMTATSSLLRASRSEGACTAALAAAFSSAAAPAASRTIRDLIRDVVQIVCRVNWRP